LKNARYENKNGCVCDPTLGQFGVRLESNYYTKFGYYNGCASIFRDEPENEANVAIYTYFHLMSNKKPISFLHFSNLDPDVVVPVFREKVVASDGNLQIGQDFPHDYMQYALKNNMDYITRTRSCTVKTFLFIMDCNEWDMQPKQMAKCRDITAYLERVTKPQKNAYTLLYKFPACYYEVNDTSVSEMYRGQYVSNPFHLIYPMFPALVRSNGLVLKRENGHWILDLAAEFRIDAHIRGPVHDYVAQCWDDVYQAHLDFDLTDEMLENAKKSRGLV
jgi:hypothetical protein